MMESSNNLNLDLHHHHHHHHQEELHGSSSSSFNFIGRDHELINQDHLLLNSINGSDFLHPNSNVVHEMMITPAGLQDLGFQWGPLILNGEGCYNNMMMNNNNHSTSTPSSSPSSSSSTHQLAHFPKQYIKEELPAAVLLPDYYCHQISGGLHDHQPTFGPGPEGSFSMVLPTANISPTTSMSYGSCLGLDNHLHSLSNIQTTFNNNVGNMAAFLREDLGYATTLSQLQAQAGVSNTGHHKVSSHSAVSGVTEAKRASSSGDSRTSQSIAKKPRFESRSSSFTPFKVRKEKLGDRIAALQQLVAPFGKTDTASVLMEAIGYIKFLQDQVETLSVPYMRSSKDKKPRASHGASNEEKDEAKPDLRSRGLCLVPLSCTSYVTNENGGVWSPPNYRGGT